MSGIGSIGGYDSNLYPWLQQTATQSSDVANDGDQDDAAATSPVQKTQAEPDASGVNGQTLNALGDRIKAAVSAALQEAERSGGTTDLKRVIANAVDQTLEDNGIDPAKLKQQLQSAMQQMTGVFGAIQPDNDQGATDGGGSPTTDVSSLFTAASAVADATQLDPSTQTLVSQLLNLNPNTQTSLLGVLFDQQN